MKHAVASSLLFLVLSGLAYPGDAVTEPPVGSPRRKAIMDGLRAPVEKKLGFPVIFVVSELRVSGRHAFLLGKPYHAQSRAPIDWRKTPFREEFESDVFSGEIVALLKEDAQGAWTPVELVWGPTDVCYLDWPEKHLLPKNLFGLEE